MRGEGWVDKVQAKEANPTQLTVTDEVKEQ
jgi:hypothetical protein